MRKNCIIFANCQGEAIHHFLKKSKEFTQNYNVRYFINFEIIEKGHNAKFFELLKSADLFIYQPLNKKHIEYATENLLLKVNKKCTIISFPYIYNTAGSPLLEIGDSNNNKENLNLAYNILGSEKINQLIKDGTSIRRAIRQLLQIKINFDLKHRFEQSIKILISKEAETDIKVSSYILQNHTTERIFLTQNHPTSGILVYCANQILKILNYGLIKQTEIKSINEANLPGYYFTTPYSNCFDLKYDHSITDSLFKNKRGNCWERQQITLLGKIYLQRHKSSKNIKYKVEKLYIGYIRFMLKLKYLTVKK